MTSARFTGIRGSEDDDGGEAANPGLPITFFDFSVTAGLADGSPTSGAIVLGWYDLSKSTFEDVSAIELGDDLVLFLTRGTAATAPGIDTESSWYWPTNDDNGVFDVAGTIATPRRQDIVTSLGGDGEDMTQQGDPLVTTVDAIDAALE